MISASYTILGNVWQLWSDGAYSCQLCIGRRLARGCFLLRVQETESLTRWHTYIMFKFTQMLHFFSWRNKMVKILRIHFIWDQLGLNKAHCYYGFVVVSFALESTVSSSKSCSYTIPSFLQCLGVHSQISCTCVQSKYKILEITMFQIKRFHFLRWSVQYVKVDSWDCPSLFNDFRMLKYHLPLIVAPGA